MITKPDKRTGVVVKDSDSYIHLLRESSVNASTKFVPGSSERPIRRVRPPKYYHPLLDKEKKLDAVVRKILPEKIADSVCCQGSRLVHLYVQPKTHKQQLAVRPILSSTNTCNYKLAQWLNDKLKPLSVNQYTVTNAFEITKEIRDLNLRDGDILVSFDVTSLFRNVPLEKTIQILADKDFKDNWFNYTYNLNLSKSDLVQLLCLATKDQLFQFEGQL